MLILDSFHILLCSFQFYFSSFVFIGIGILTAIGRVSQVLFKSKFSKPTYLLTELFVEGLRVIQYVLFILVSRNIDLDLETIWLTIIGGLQDITYPQIIWNLLGFLIVFGIYNVLVFLVFSKNNTSKLMNTLNLNRYPVKSFQLALVLGFKNIFLIPLSVIYLFHLLHII